MLREPMRRRLSSFALLSCLCSCAGNSGGPAWPKSAGTVASEDWSEDGGESIAPFTTRAVAVERSAEPVAEAKPAEAVASKAAEPAEPPRTTPEAAPSSDPIELPDEVIGEEIIIEIED